MARAKKGRASDRLDLVAAHKGVRAMRNDLITLQLDSISAEVMSDPICRATKKATEPGSKKPI